MGKPVCEPELYVSFYNKFIALKYFSGVLAVEFYYRVEQAREG